MKLLTFRRSKMKPAAESKNLLPQARTWWTRTDEQAADRAGGRDQRFDHLCLGLRGQCKRVYIGGTFIPGSWSLLGLKDQPLVPVRDINRDWKATFNPGLKQTGTKAPCCKSLLHYPLDRRFYSWLAIPARTKSKNPKSIITSIHPLRFERTVQPRSAFFFFVSFCFLYLFFFLYLYLSERSLSDRDRR
jgi:hypothetical protein